MPTLDRDELTRFLGEHLTAAAEMVPIDTPIDFAQWMVHGRASWSASLFQFILLSARTWGLDLVERASTGVTREQQRPRGTLAALEIVG